MTGEINTSLDMGRFFKDGTECVEDFALNTHKTDASQDGSSTQNMNADVFIEANSLATDMVVYARDSLLENYRFLSRASIMLPFRIDSSQTSCATDGYVALFSPEHVFNAWRLNHKLVARSYLHMIIHCLMRHPFFNKDVDTLRWSVATDIATAIVIRDLECEAIVYPCQERDLMLDKICTELDSPSAQLIYHKLENKKISQARLIELSLLFGLDSHELWLKNNQKTLQQAQEKQNQKLDERWEKIARQTRIDIKRDTKRGTGSASLTKQLSYLEADPMGLEELLQNFASIHEHLRVNPDEFDYIYYSYGLLMYKTMPLIEELEYCENLTIRDFVIAIDTSGSVSGSLVKAFLEKACGMLMAATSVSASTRIRIIQCDNTIQDEAVVVGQKQVQHYLDNVVVRGFGGTDFRPVFEHVDHLLNEAFLDDLAGLIYFTDGMGIFPKHAPSYDVAFVFIDQARPVPSWATQAIAYSEELMRGGTQTNEY